MTVCLCCQDRGAAHRYACPQCVTTMRTWLGEIEGYVDEISAMPERRRGVISVATGSAFASSPPLDLDKIVYLDPRSVVQDNRDPVIDDPTGIYSLPAAIDALTLGVCTTLAVPADQQPRRGLTPRLRWLRTVVDRIAQERWVDRVHEGLRVLHHTARRLAHDDPPKPLGRCLGVACAGPVWTTDDGGRCGRCGRPYRGLDLIRLQTAQEVPA